MTDVVVVANTAKIPKKEVRELEASLSAALLGEGRAITVDFTKKRHFEMDGSANTRTKSLEFKVHPRSLHVVAQA